MDIRVAGNQLVLSGLINGDELARMRDVLPANPQIDTVVLKDSPGGDIWTAMRLGELFAERGFKTAVSGYCISACVVVFLGGRERTFADGKESSRTFLAIHTPTYGASDHLRYSAGQSYVQARGRLADWMGPRIKDQALLERGLSNPNPAGFLYLFGGGSGPATVYQCKGTEKRKIADCEAIHGTDALRAGFITHTTILEVR